MLSLFFFTRLHSHLFQHQLVALIAGRDERRREQSRALLHL